MTTRTGRRTVRATALACVTGVLATLTVAALGASPAGASEANTKTAFDFFLDKGLTPVQAAGVVGNLSWESGGVDPTSVGGTAHGIAQWETPRWESIPRENENWYADFKGESKYSLSLQLKFVWWELTHKGYGYADLRDATTVEDAETIFEKHYEVPDATQAHHDDRIRLAKKALADYGDDQPPAPARFDGQFDHVVNDGAGRVHVAGWAYDRQATGSSIRVEVHDGAAADAPVLGTLTADDSRPDVDRVYRISGNHGFDGYLTGLQAGRHHLVLVAVNAGKKNIIDDADYTVSPPDGRLEHALSSSAGKYHIAGWAYDPDQPSASIQVDVYLQTSTGDKFLGTIAADDARADVNRNLGITGDHGYDGIVNAPSGAHNFDIYAVHGSSHAVIATNQFTIA